MTKKRTKAEIISLLTNPGVIAVIRAPRAEHAPRAAEAIIAGGINVVEITMTTPNAISAIRETRKLVGEHALLGVGTVLDADTCRAAMDAGAEFVVTPVCRPALIPVAHAAQRPIMIGCYTPTEAQTAHEAGADFIKIFPSDTLGARYIRALLAPLPHLRIVPTGGVEVGNIGEFFRAGCVAVGVGSSLVSAKILQDEAWPELTQRARALVEAARQATAR